MSVEADGEICAAHATVWLVAEHRLVIPPLDDEDASPDEEDASFAEDAAPPDEEDASLAEDAALLPDEVVLPDDEAAEDEGGEDEAPLLDELLADDAPPSLPALVEAFRPCDPQLATAIAAGTERSETPATLKRWERTKNAIIER